MDLKSLFTKILFVVNGQVVQVWSVGLAAAVIAAAVICMPRLKVWIKDRFSGGSETNHRFITILCYCLYIVVGLVVINVLGLYSPIKAELANAHKEVSTLLDLRLFAIGKTSMTLWSCIYVFGLSWILIRATEKMSEIISKHMSSATKLDVGMIDMCSSTARYSVMALGLAVILQSAGVDLSALSFIAGAAGIAIGLGLQALMNNVVSGLVILLDHPIKIGDRIDIAGVNGEVRRISLRATTVITNDNMAVIVPNSQFISSQVVNWTYTDKKCRFKFPVTVDRNASPALIQRLLLEVAQSHPGVLQLPPPKACFDEIGGDKLTFSLSVWTQDYVGKPNDLKSDINYAIAQKFNEKGLTLYGAVKQKAEDASAAKESKEAA